MLEYIYTYILHTNICIYCTPGKKKKKEKALEIKQNKIKPKKGKILLLGIKAMAHLDSGFKSRNITLPTKVHIVKNMVFPVVMYVCESWTIKKTEH